MFRSITEARDDDPDEGAFDALIALIGAMEQAHAALGAGGADADAKVSAFESAVCACAPTTRRAGGGRGAPAAAPGRAAQFSLGEPAAAGDRDGAGPSRARPPAPTTPPAKRASPAAAAGVP